MFEKISTIPSSFSLRALSTLKSESLIETLDFFNLFDYIKKINLRRLPLIEIRRGEDPLSNAGGTFTKLRVDPKLEEGILHSC